MIDQLAVAPKPRIKPRHLPLPSIDRRGLMDLECAIELLKECGCTVEPHEYRENWVTVVDPDGNFLHLTGIEDEAPRVLGKAYGLIDNDPTMMADTLEMTGEG